MSNEYNLTMRSDNTQVKWDDCLVRLLVESCKELNHLPKKGKVTKKYIFDEVGCHVNKTATVQVTGGQCQQKCLKLEQKYKDAEDNNWQTAFSSRF